jgi:uroporphyrin-3 C-methyltransferase
MPRKSTPKRKKESAEPKEEAAIEPSADKRIESDDAAEPGQEGQAIETSSANGSAEEERVVPPDEEAGDDSHPQGPDETESGAELPPPEPARPRRGITGFIGWLALILSLGAIAGTGYLLFDHWRVGKSTQESDAALAGLNGALGETRNAISDLQQRLDTLAERETASVAELQSLERSLNERVREFDSLPGRVGNLEDSISSIQGISTGVRDAWLLAEAEYYMQIANAQLQLAGNPHLAGLALRFADQRLLQLADPALTDIRRALFDELRAIEMMERPDIEGVTLTLASLAGVVDSLPLRQEISVPDADEAQIDPDLSGIDRALASLRRTVGDVVSVRRTDEAIEPLMAPDAQYFLRANLALQLQAARLALLRSEEEIFEQSLDDASAWLTRYYDTETSAVQSALETVAEIRNALFTVSSPDISESLRLLRQHATLSESAKLPATEPE